MQEADGGSAAAADVLTLKQDMLRVEALVVEALQVVVVRGGYWAMAALCARAPRGWRGRGGQALLLMRLFLVGSRTASRRGVFAKQYKLIST
jgi:hypothetical protein